MYEKVALSVTSVVLQTAFVLLSMLAMKYPLGVRETEGKERAFVRVCREVRSLVAFVRHSLHTPCDFGSWRGDS